MLANVIADNFDSFESIDWTWIVSNFPEFSGHSEISLRYFYFNKMAQKATRYFKKERINLTIKDIQYDVEHNKTYKPPSKKVEKRQKDLMEYFESEVKRLKINNFV